MDFKWIELLIKWTLNGLDRNKSRSDKKIEFFVHL